MWLRIRFYQVTQVFWKVNSFVIDKQFEEGNQIFSPPQLLTLLLHYFQIRILLRRVCLLHRKLISFFLWIVPCLWSSWSLTSISFILKSAIFCRTRTLQPILIPLLYLYLTTWTYDTTPYRFRARRIYEIIFQDFIVIVVKVSGISLIQINPDFLLFLVFLSLRLHLDRK